MKTQMKIDEIRKIGINALSESLGPDGMMRFMQQYDSGSGNYTKERNKIFKQYTIDQIYEEIKHSGKK